MTYRVHDRQMLSSLQARRVSLRSIEERPACIDPVLGQLFRTMRTTLGRPPEVIASVIGTTTDVIARLEAGDLRALPPLPETRRLITAYGQILELDVRPILHRLEQQLEPQLALSRMPAATPAPPAPLPQVARLPTGPAAARAPVQHPLPARPRAAPTTATGPLQQVIAATAAVAGTLRHRARSAGWQKVVAAVAVAGMLGALWLAGPIIGAVTATADLMPGSRTGGSRQAAIRAPGADGLVWIDVADPRTRKADRLDP